MNLLLGLRGVARASLGEDEAANRFCDRSFTTLTSSPSKGLDFAQSPTIPKPLEPKNMDPKPKFPIPLDPKLLKH